MSEVRNLIEMGKLESAIELLKNTSDPDGLTPLHFAVLHQDNTLIANLLEGGANPNAKTTNLVSCFPEDQRRCQRPKSATFYLPDPRPEIGEMRAFDKGTTPIHIAAALGNLDILQKLLEHKARPDIKDHFGASPLHLACLAGNEQVALKLLNSKVNVHAATKGKKSVRFYDAGTTPLLAAAEGGNLAIVDALVGRNGDPTLCTKAQCCSLFFAARSGKLEVVDLLLAAGAKYPGTVTFETSPLVEAVKAGALNIVERLVALGAITDDLQSHRPAVNAATELNYQEIRKTLIAAGASLPSYSGVHHAAKSNDVAYVRDYLENAGDPNAVEGAFSILMSAVDGDASDVCALLLKSGADVDFHTQIGTAVHRAVIMERWSILDLLLDSGASCSMTDDHGNQPLGRAIQKTKPRPDLARRMIIAGSRPDHRNLHGVSALDRATSFGREDLLELFGKLKAGAEIKSIEAKFIAKSEWNWVLFETKEGSLILEVLCNRGAAYWSRLVLLSPSIKPNDTGVFCEISAVVSKSAGGVEQAPDSLRGSRLLAPDRFIKAMSN